VSVELKRAYDKPSAKDGARVLVDRLWPRGIKKSDARIQVWLRDLAPSTELRQWFHEKDSPGFFPEFRKRYLHELSEPAASAALQELYRLIRSNRIVTLVYASKNNQQNNATVLRDLLNGMRKPPTSSGPARAAAAGKRARMSKS